VGHADAGILGPLAMAVAMLPGVVCGAGLERTLVTGIVNLFAFSAVGLILGSVAQSTVDDAVWLKLGQPLVASGASGEESLSESNG
jgi:hypothetical protein